MTFFRSFLAPSSEKNLKKICMAFLSWLQAIEGNVPNVKYRVKDGNPRGNHKDQPILY